MGKDKDHRGTGTAYDLVEHFQEVPGYIMPYPDRYNILRPCSHGRSGARKYDKDLARQLLNARFQWGN